MQDMQAGPWLGHWSWSSACQAGMGQSRYLLGPVNTKPKGLLSHAYEIGGLTEVLTPVPLRHIDQAEACVCLHILTDPGLRGQETGLRHTPSQLQKDVRMRQGKGPQRRAGGWAAPRKLPGKEAHHGSVRHGLRKKPSPHVCHHRYTNMLTHTDTEWRRREVEERERKPVTYSLKTPTPWVILGPPAYFHEHPHPW